MAWLKLIGLKFSPVLEFVADNVVTVPQEPGVYRIHVLLENGDWWPIFVGQADDMQEQIWQHKQAFEPNEKLNGYLLKYVCGFSWARCKDNRVRQQAVRAIYDELQPACNNPKELVAAPEESRWVAVDPSRLPARVQAKE